VTTDDPIEAGIRRINLRLTSTERYVLAMVCAGERDANIAVALRCGRRKAAGIVSRLLEKTATTSRVALVAEVLAGLHSVRRANALARKAWQADTVPVRRAKA
jgi:DNA-binding CsgD family transcriptional regulator